MSSPSPRPSWRRARAPQLAGVPATFTRRFRNVDPSAAVNVAAQVQRRAYNAMPRQRELVVNVILDMASKFGMCDKYAWTHLRAGRWLLRYDGRRWGRLFQQLVQ